MGAEEDRIQSYIEAVNNLKFKYTRFEGNSILWVAATVNKQRIVYINSNLAKCINGININTQDFVEKAKKIHENKYEYFKETYIKRTEPIKIKCPIHGEFWQLPKTHLRGNGCTECGKEKTREIQEERRIKTEKFIERAKEVHGDKYDYSKVKCTCGSDIVTIICPKHGEFKQKAYWHLNGSGCSKCYHERSSTLRKTTLNEFKEQQRSKSSRLIIGGGFFVMTYFPTFAIQYPMSVVRYMKIFFYFCKAD
jgi:hypothetical protein